MKTILYISAVILFIVIVSCRHTNGKKQNAVAISDTSQINFDKKGQDRLEERKKMEEQDYADSLKLDEVLRDGLKIANQNISKNHFFEKYEVFPDGIQVTVEISLDYHFTKTNPHLVVRRDEPNSLHIDIYSKNDYKFEKAVSYKQWKTEYLNDTICDINGDGLNDFVVNWYGSTGCCLKAFSNVYLLRQDNKEFSEPFRFINPTFSPKEKVVRGVCYGHPGETEMYKYKWNGEKMDTLEYISHEKNGKGEKTGKILVSTNKPYGDKYKALKLLISVPAEYKKIEGYDWFTGDL